MDICTSRRLRVIVCVLIVLSLMSASESTFQSFALGEPDPGHHWALDASTPQGDWSHSQVQATLVNHNFEIAGQSLESELESNEHDHAYHINASHKQQLNPRTLLNTPKPSQSHSSQATIQQERQTRRHRNALNIVSNLRGSISEYTQPDSNTKRPPGTTRAHLQDKSKPSTGNTTPKGLTTHSWSAKADSWFAQQPYSPTTFTTQRKNAERVVTESLRHPDNDQTRGAGPDVAHSVLRASIHTTPSTGLRGGGPHMQQVVTSVQRHPGSQHSTVRHLPVIWNERTGEAHFYPTDEAKFAGRGRDSIVPAPRKLAGSSFVPLRRRALRIRTG